MNKWLAFWGAYMAFALVLTMSFAISESWPAMFCMAPSLYFGIKGIAISLLDIVRARRKI